MLILHFVICFTYFRDTIAQNKKTPDTTTKLNKETKFKSLWIEEKQLEMLLS